MKEERMMEKFLDNVGFGMEPKISEVGALVFADEDLLVADILKKDARAIRINKTKSRKLRNKKLYLRNGEVHYTHRAYYDRDDSIGIVPIFHGEDNPIAFIKKGKKPNWLKEEHKVANRKVRYQKITLEEPILDNEDAFDRVGEDNWTWWYQTLPLGEDINDKVWDAWWEYCYSITMEAVVELDKIKHSIIRLHSLNNTLQSEKLEQNIKNLFHTWRENHKF